MPTSSFWFKACLIVFALLILTSCGAGGGSSLPLEDYNDPQGRYTFVIPQGWQSDLDAEALTLTPPDYQGTQEELIVYVYTSPTNTTDSATHIDLAKKQIEPFLETILDEDYQVVNEGQTKVDKYPAMLLDFAKPHEDSYMLGRVVIVAMPFYALVFLGKGVEANWEAFVPTFREMLKQFHLSSAAAPEATEVLP